MNSKTVFKSLLVTAIATTMIFGCKKEDQSKNTGTTANGDPTSPGTTSAITCPSTSGTADLSIYKKIYGATCIYQDSDYVVIKTTGLPDHPSPYYSGTAWQNRYEGYNGTGFFLSNNYKIAQKNYTFRIPLNPKEAIEKDITWEGQPIGVALNGVPFYNQIAVNGAPLHTEFLAFDQYNGHPEKEGDYHYHFEPVFLTKNKGKSALLGFLLDGFPVYGPMENGFPVYNLDIYHGHKTATKEYPDSIYHYHITSSDPYIVGGVFFGAVGTVSK